jgi:hypothetical protein
MPQSGRDLAKGPPSAVILISILRSGSGMMSLKDLKEHHYTESPALLSIIV